MNLVHTGGLECPICRGICRLATVNSLMPYEEIDAEIRRSRSGQPEDYDDLPLLFPRKKFR